MTLSCSRRENQPPQKPSGNPPKKTPAAAKKRSKTPAEKRMDRIRRLAAMDMSQNAAADFCARQQWARMDARGPLVFNTTPTASELEHQRRREELRELPLNELCENIAENKERLRDELRSQVVPDPEGDAHNDERIQRAKDRSTATPSEPPKPP